jgi:dihydrofolate reductase
MAEVVYSVAVSLIPVVLGGGLRLFDAAHPPEYLRLDDSKVWDNGVVQLRYEVIKP